MNPTRTLTSLLLAGALLLPSCMSASTLRETYPGHRVLGKKTETVYERSCWFLRFFGKRWSRRDAYVVHLKSPEGRTLTLDLPEGVFRELTSGEAFPPEGTGHAP